jgi:hypothetical protein
MKHDYYFVVYYKKKDKPKIRTSAYMLFGELARFGQGPSKDPYLEQIHSNFVNFVLHLNEQDEEVRKSCKHVLKQVGPLIESSSVNDLFQSSLINDSKSFHYGEFVNDLAKLLVNQTYIYICEIEASNFICLR